MPTMQDYKGQQNSRWLVLLLSSCMMIGSYYCYDNPSALNEQLEDYFTNVVPKGTWWKGSIEESSYAYYFNLLYAVYSLPNIVLPFFGGYLTDKLSARLMNVVFCICLLIGQITVTIGAFIGSFPLMILGRVFFGFGGESLCVSVQTLIAQWFNESLKPLPETSIVRRFGLGIAFAMGLNLSISRLGSVFNNIVSPAVAQHFAHRHDFSDATAAADAAAGYSDELAAAGSGSSSPADAAASAGPGVPYALGFGCLVMSAATVASIVTFVIDAAAERAGERAGYGDGGGSSVRASSEATERLLPETAQEEESEEINLSAVFSFHSAFWLLSVSCISVYACVLPWNNIAQAFLLEKYVCPGGCAPKVLTNPTEFDATNTVKVKQPPKPHTHTHPSHTHAHTAGAMIVIIVVAAAAAAHSSSLPLWHCNCATDCACVRQPAQQPLAAGR
jgi:MFS family permease